jgi:hypothetical protein
MQQQLPRRVENLHVVEQPIHHIDMPERINGEAFGTAELAGAIANPADLALIRPRAIQHLNPAIHRISHQQVALRVQRQVGREVELALARPAPAKFALLIAV